LKIAQFRFNKIDKEATAFGEKLILENNKKGLEEMVAKGVKVVHFEDQKKMLGMVPNMVEEWVRQASKAGGGEEATRQLAVFLRQCIKEMESGN